jgi:integrase
MADISTDKNGNRRLRYYELRDGERVRTGFRIGKLDKKTADRLCEDVEAILAAKMMGQPLHTVVAERIGRLGPQYRSKMERAGLLEPAEPKQAKAKLGDFLTAYISGRSDLKTSTKDNLLQAKTALLTYFAADRLLEAVTPGDAEEFRSWLQTGRKRPLSANTARRLCGRAKQFFRHAVRKRLIAENPFGDMKRLAVRGTSDRRRFITDEVIGRVLDACPNADWRVLVVLCRYGGLRPSEACDLRWEHVDWGRSRLRVRCGKTEHHEGREWREVPIFPEIMPRLQESWELAEPGAERVIAKYRSSQNLRKPFQDIVRKAGLEAWPKPFQNMRSTRETELASRHPIHVVCNWIGNTQPVAREHYLQVTEEDFLRAVSGDERGNAAPMPAISSCGDATGHRPTGGPKSGPEPASMERREQHRAKQPKLAGVAKSGPDAGCSSSATRSESAKKSQSSPSRIRTYNLAVNSRSLYR